MESPQYHTCLLSYYWVEDIDLYCMYTIGKLQFIHLWFCQNLSCLLVVWNLILYPLEFNWNLSCLPMVWNLMIQVFCWILFYFIWSCIFIFFAFLEERDMKVKQNYIFCLVFNRGGLQKSNWANLKWVKCQISNHKQET